MLELLHADLVKHSTEYRRLRDELAVLHRELDFLEARLTLERDFLALEGVNVALPIFLKRAMGQSYESRKRREARAARSETGANPSTAIPPAPRRDRGNA